MSGRTPTDALCSVRCLQEARCTPWLRQQKRPYPAPSSVRRRHLRFIPPRAKVPLAKLCLLRMRPSNTDCGGGVGSSCSPASVATSTRSELTFTSATREQRVAGVHACSTARPTVVGGLHNVYSEIAEALFQCLLLFVSRPVAITAVRRRLGICARLSRGIQRFLLALSATPTAVAVGSFASSTVVITATPIPGLGFANSSGHISLAFHFHLPITGNVGNSGRISVRASIWFSALKPAATTLTSQ